MKRQITVSFLLLLACNTTLKSQVFDSLNLNIGTFFTLASEEYQPLWLSANRFGIIADDKNADLSTYLSLRNSHYLGLKRNSGLDLNSEKSKNSIVELSYGIDIFNNNSFGDVFFQEAFLKVKYRKWQLAFGRFEDLIGEVNHELSSGSLGVSSNAIPIPKVSIRNTDYVEIPLTNGWFHFKGLISHGWMGEQRLLKDAFLHEKSFYLKFGKNKISLYGGVQHFGIWGGSKSSNYELDRSFQGFLNVLFVKEANDGSVAPGRLPNRAGFQRGSVDGGIVIENNNNIIHIYNQTPIATGTSISIKNIDRLFGVTFENKKTKLLKSLLLEFLYTKQMSDFEGAKEPYYYYTNGVYSTGWNYLDRVIGNPLIINRNRGSFYFEGVNPPVWDPGTFYPINYNILSNRVVALHLGLNGNLLDQFSYKLLWTVSRNYGNYLESPDLFDPYKDQINTLHEIKYNFNNSGISVTGGIGVDLGALSNNVGMMMGIEWQRL